MAIRIVYVFTLLLGVMVFQSPSLLPLTSKQMLSVPLKTSMPSWKSASLDPEIIIEKFQP